MQVNGSYEPDPRWSPRFEPGDSSFRPQPSAKLRDNLQKLAKWRICPSSIEFPEDSCEFRGGYATVSRAFLVSTSSDGHKMDDPANSGFDNMSNDEACRRKSVAVKKLSIGNGKERERVLGLALREAGFLAEIFHENIIGLEGFVEDESNNRVWLVFPWADNGNLKDFVASVDWEIPERISLMNDVVRGVEHLHSRDPPISHGDLKSINVLVNTNYRAVITDFGSARHLAQKDLDTQTKKTANGAQPELVLEATICPVTNSITLTGNQYTLRWAAPELLMDDELGLWSDIWALGWIFYEVITNSIPFQNVKKDSVVIKHVIQGDLPSVTDHARLLLIRELYSLMVTCWSIDPFKRPTAEDCRKSMTWMPMIIPDPQRAANMSIRRARPPPLLMQLGYLHRQQNDYVNASNLFTEALVAYTNIADMAGKASALLALAHVYRLQNEYGEAVRLYTEVIEINTSTDNAQGRADALWGLAEVHRLQDEYDEAVTAYSEAAKINTDIGNIQGRAAAVWGLAEVHRVQTEYSKAITFYSEVVDINTDIGDRQGRANALLGLAHVHMLQNEFGEAVTVYSAVVQIHTDMGSERGRANALLGLAHVHLLQNEYDEAVRLYSDVIQIHADIGNRQGRADALWSLAEVHRLQDEYDEAITLYSQAVKINADIGNIQGRAAALWGLAEVHRAQEEYSEAARFYSEIVQINAEIGKNQGRSDALFGLAEIHRAQKKYSEAVAFYSDVVQICTNSGNRQGGANALLGLAHVHRLQHQYSEAVPLYSEVIQIYIDIGDKRGRADALWGLAEVHRLQNEGSQAAKLFYEALKIYTDIGNGKGRAFCLFCLANVRRNQDLPKDAIPGNEQVAESYEHSGHAQDAARASTMPP